MAEVRLNITVTNQGGAVITSVQESLSSLGKTSDTVQTKMSGFSSVLAGFGAGAGLKVFDTLTSSVGALVSSLPSAVSNLVSTSGAITDLAARSGFSTEALQKFSYAGAMVGVSAEEISTGMLKLQKNLTAGSEETSAALDRLGISLSDLRSMTPEDQLATVVESLQRITDPAERSALAMQLLGRGGAALIPLGENLRSVMENAERLGVVMDASVIAAADDLGDSVSAMSAVWTGLQNNLVSVIVTSEPLHVLISGLTDILGQLSVIVRDNQESLRGLVDAGVVFVAEALVRPVQASAFVVDAWSGLKIMGEALSASFEALGLYAIALWDLLSNPKGAVQTFQNLKQAMSDLAARTQQAVDQEMAANARRQEVVSKVSSVFEQLRDKVTNAVGATHQARAAADEHASAEGRRGAALSQTRAAAKEAAEGLKTYADVTRSAQAELRQLSASAEGSLSGKLQGITEKTRGSMEKLQDAFKKTGDAEGFERAASEVMKLDAALRSAAMNQARLSLMGKSMQDFAKEAREATTVYRAFLEGGGSLSDYSDAGLRSMLDNFEKLASGLDKSSSEYQSLSGVMDEVKARMSETGALTSDQIKDWERNYQASKKYWDEQDKKQEEAQKQWEEQNLKVQDFRTSLEQLLGVLESLGATSLAGLGKSLLQGADAGKQMANSIRNIGKNGLTLENVGSLVAGAGSAVSSFMDATDKRSRGQRALGGAMTGAGLGSKIGSLAGPVGGVVGAVAGGLIGGIAGAFRSPGWTKAADEASRRFGYQVSDDLAKAIEQTSKDKKLSRGDASLLHLSDAMAESGKDARSFSSSVTSLMTRISQGAIPAKEGIAEIGSSFSQIAEEAQKAGSVGDRAMVDIIRRSRELGLRVPEISEHVKTQLQGAIQGVSALVGQMSEVDGKKAFSGIQIVDVQGAQDQATIFSSVFWSSVKELGVVQAADAMREPFAALKAKIGDSLGADAASAVMGPMDRMFGLTAEGNPFRGAVQGADGLRQALDGLANSGYLTTSSFEAIEHQALSAVNQMTAAGATPAEALQSSAPLLQSLVSTAQNYGLQLDSNTQSLVSQAQQAGVVFQTDPQQRMVQALEAIALKLGAELPAAAGAAASSMGALATSTSTSMDEMSASTEGAIDSLSAVADSSVDAISATVGETSASMGDITASTAASLDSLTTSAGSGLDAMSASATSTLSAIGEGLTTSTAGAAERFTTLTSDLATRTSEAGSSIAMTFQQLADGTSGSLADKLGMDLPAATAIAGASLGALASEAGLSLDSVAMTADASFMTMASSSVASFDAVKGGVDSAMGEVVAVTGSATDAAAGMFVAMGDTMAGKAAETSGAVSSTFQEMAAEAASAVSEIGSRLDVLSEPITIPIDFDVAPYPDIPGGGGGGDGGSGSGDGSDIPGYAMGGIIDPRPGGTIARLAEAGQSEVVMPVRTLLNNLRDSIVAGVASLTPAQQGAQPIIVNVQIPFQPLISFMETVQKTGALRLLPSQLKEF